MTYTKLPNPISMNGILISTEIQKTKDGKVTFRQTYKTTEEELKKRFNGIKARHEESDKQKSNLKDAMDGLKPFIPNEDEE